MQCKLPTAVLPYGPRIQTLMTAEWALSCPAECTDRSCREGPLESGMLEHVALGTDPSKPVQPASFLRELCLTPCPPGHTLTLPSPGPAGAQCHGEELFLLCL